MNLPQPALGTHVSVAGGLAQAIRRGVELDCQAIQICTKSNRQWHAAPIRDEDAEAFRQAWQASTIQHVVVHAAYLINLASARPEIRQRSTDALIDEVRRASRLGCPAVVVHPGSHGGGGLEAGCQFLVDGLNRTLDATADCTTVILVETMAGQGTCIGARFETLATVLARVDAPSRIGICLDSCHVHAAGYPVTSAPEVDAMVDALAHSVGLGAVRAVHLNDSRHAAGSHKDRHAHIGEGTIGLAGFAALLRHPALRRLPMVLETPKTTDEMPPEDIRNLAALRNLVN